MHKPGQFADRAARHFAALRRRDGAGSDPKPPFPDGWFDLDAELYADFGAMFYLAALVRFHAGRSLAAATSTFEPALRLGQYHIFRTDGFPRAFVSWAGLSPETERRFALERSPLRAEEWNDGPSVWLIDFVAPFGHMREIVPRLTENPALRRLRALWLTDGSDSYRIIEWTRAAAGGRVDEMVFSPAQFARHLDES